MAVVSVIVPVHNTAQYLPQCLDSVFGQTLAQSAIEIIAVDDGSTDDSGALLDRYARAHPNLAVIHQPASGHAGAARNVALERASGEFLFFLDSDDYLAPHALERMVDAARQAGSDVVLGRIRGLEGRRAPASMFRETVLDADLAASNIIHTLGPWKLIRHSLVQRVGLRFPEDQKVGEDEPFMASCYLAAGKVSILADDDYYFLRGRADGTGLSEAPQTAEQSLRRALRLAAVVDRYAEPGPVREVFMRRPFRTGVREALDPRLLDLPAEERDAVLRTAREVLRPHYTPEVAAGLPTLVQLRIALAFEAGTEVLLELLRAEAERGFVPIVATPAGLAHQVPEAVRRAVPAALLTAPEPAVRTRLNHLVLSGDRLEVACEVLRVGMDQLPERADVVLVHRVTSEEVLLGAQVQPGAPGPDGRPFTVVGQVDPRVLTSSPPGTWDAHVQVHDPDRSRRTRFGRVRGAGVTDEPVSVELPDGPADRSGVVAYFTRTHGNLSVVVAGVDRARRVAGREESARSDTAEEARGTAEAPAPEASAPPAPEAPDAPPAPGGLRGVLGRAAGRLTKGRRPGSAS